MRRAIPAKGSIKRGNGVVAPTMQRVVCIFPPDLFQEVRDRAVRNGTSFAEQVRLLVEWGLEADE